MRKLKNKHRRLIKILIACASVLGCSPLASAQDVKPETTANNHVEVSDENYAVNNTSEEYEGELEMVYGGGDEDGSEPASGNQIEITGGKITGGVIGGISSTGDVSYNRIEINGGFVENAIGGVTSFAYGNDNEPGNVVGNEVIVRGGEVGYVSGGEIGVSYADDENMPESSRFQQMPVAAENRVRIEADGKITGGIIGGVTYNGMVVGNTIDIEGGSVGKEVIAGWIRNPIDGAYFISGNSINISGSPDLSDAFLIGGLLGEGESRKYSPDNNFLNINTSDITAKNIAGFSDINFNLPINVADGSTVLTLTDGETDLSGVHIAVNAHGDSALEKNSRFSLIVNRNGFNGVGNGELQSSADVDEGDGSIKKLGDMTYNGTMSKGASFDYDLELALSDDGNSFDAIVGERHVSEERVMPPIQNFNLDPIRLPIEDEVFREVEETTSTSGATTPGTLVEHHGYEVFGNLGGGHMKTKTGNGSYIKSNMVSYDFGFARNFKRDSSILTFAPVFEYGHGTFDSHLSSGIDGDGKQTYMAGGVVVRSMNNSGFYYEGSVRAGKSKTRYSSDPFEINDRSVHVSYNVDAPVVMGHVRLGNQFRMGQNHVLEFTRDRAVPIPISISAIITSSARRTADVFARDIA